MEVDRFKERLQSLNGAKIGSFGEYIFIQYTKERKFTVASVHDGAVDYTVCGKKVDVKTKRFFECNIIDERMVAVNNRQEAILYPHVLFLRNDVEICDEKCKILRRYNYDEISKLFQERSNQGDQEPNRFNIRQNDGYESLEAEIKDFFRERGKFARLIYRTTPPDLWGGEGGDSPHNLLPTQILKNHVTVYLAFNQYVRDRNKMAWVIAFPDEDSVSFPLLPKQKQRMVNHLKRKVEKVDLSRLSPKYKFRNVEELFSEFFKRF